MKIGTQGNLEELLYEKKVIRTCLKGDDPFYALYYLLLDGVFYWESNGAWVPSAIEDEHEMFTECDCFYDEDDQWRAEEFWRQHEDGNL